MMSVAGKRVRAWWKNLAHHLRRTHRRAGFIGPIGAPRVKDKNPVTGEVKFRFRHDVRIDAEIYEMYKKLCEGIGETPSAQTRKLIMEWIKKQIVLDPWMEFVKKMKSEGFSTPQEWLKSKLDIDDI